MKPVELFGVAVRVVGLLIATAALFLILLGTFNLIFNGPAFIDAFLLGIPSLFVGIYFLSGAELLVKSVYPKDPLAP